MKNFKRFIVIILAICAVMVCASCKKCSKDKNRLIPTLSDPTGTYLKIGNYTITKKDVYYQLLNSYGTEVLLNMVDDALLPALSDEEGFQEYLDEIIYGDEEKTDEVKQKFLDELILSGLSKNPEDDNYYETYYRLVYRRLEYGKKYFKDHMEEDYFKDEDIEKAFENTYRKTNDLIIIRIISDNSIIEIHRSNFTFVPNVGDSIEIFKNDDETIVTKMDQESETSNMNEHDDGINIDSNGNMYTDEPEFNGKKVVNKFMYCILAIFFGGLGLHKFYCRKKEIGLLYLALFWTGIPWAISIIDFIIALTKKADSNGNILI